MVSKVNTKIIINRKLKEFTDLIAMIAKMEYNKFSMTNLVDYTELVNIGTQAVHYIILNGNIDECNISYVATAIKWAIRNEIRRRYKWYVLRTKASEEEFVPNENDVENLREALYSTILSIEEMADAEIPTIIKDPKQTPEQSAEFIELSAAIREAIKKLPPREKELLEKKFYRGKKLKDLQDEYHISPSRISRIIKIALDKIKKELAKQNMIES